MMEKNGMEKGAAIDERQLHRFVEDLHELRRQQSHAYAELERANRFALSRLALAAEYKDDETGRHIERIGELSGLLAEAIGLPVWWCRCIEQAAPMHDIGKIGIPDHILKKQGRLDREELKVMQTHPLIGAHILGENDVPVLQMAAEIALCHHERWDGSGYPRKLKGEQIPLSARIVALIDCFDALTMDRCYRKAVSDENTLELLRAEEGRHFDPAVTAIALKVFPRLTKLRDEINRRERAPGMRDEISVKRLPI